MEKGLKGRNKDLIRRTDAFLLLKDSETFLLSKETHQICEQETLSVGVTRGQHNAFLHVF